MTLQRKIKSNIRNFAPELIDKIQIVIGKTDKTYGGEFATLSQILDKLDISTFLEFVDIGAGDGYNMSVAFPISKKFACRGLLIEPNLKQLERARRLFRDEDFQFNSEYTTPDNIPTILTEAGFSKPTYIKIDIDSFDLDLLRGILLNNVRPKVFSIEINELFPPPCKFEVKYTGYQVQFSQPLYGCSLQSVTDFANEMDYSLISLAFNNAFYVDNSLKPIGFPDKNVDIKEIYNSGFLNRNWQTLYPWDVKFEDWLYASTSELYKIIENHNSFDRSSMVIG